MSEATPGTGSVDGLPRGLVIASNRGPIAFERGPGGELTPRRGAGGLVTALTHVMAGTGGLWMAAAITPGDREMVRRRGDYPLEVPVDQGTIKLRYLLFERDRKSTRLNSSHSQISYAVFCLKKKIEYGPLSPFFEKNSELPSELLTYFAGFDLVINYLYDPDGIFESNLRRCGVELRIRGPAKIDKGEHAARQLARPMQELGLAVADLAAKVYPSTEDRQRGQEFLRDLPRPLVVFHPGSGIKRKNWPLENWIDIGNGLLDLDDFQGSLVIVSGEADEDRVRSLRAIWKNERVQFAKNFPLPKLAV